MNPKTTQRESKMCDMIFGWGEGTKSAY